MNDLPLATTRLPKQIFSTKSLFLLVGWLFYPLFLQAQPYQPMAVEGAHWIYRIFEKGNEAFPISAGSYIVRGDTVVKGIHHKRLYFDAFKKKDPYYRLPYEIARTSLVGFLRDDTLRKRVYLLQITTLPIASSSCNPIPALLLFDFSVSVGDTVNFWCPLSLLASHYGIEAVTHAIGYGKYKTESNLRRYVEIRFSGNSLHKVWEGIGYDRRGLLLIEPFTTQGQYIGDWIGYCLGSHENCGITSAVQEAPVSALRLQPNPVLDELRITGVNEVFSQRTTLSLYDLAGRLCKKEQINALPTSLDVGTLVPGWYLAHLQLPTGEVYRSLFVKY